MCAGTAGGAASSGGRLGRLHACSDGDAVPAVDQDDGHDDLGQVDLVEEAASFLEGSDGGGLGFGVLSGQAGIAPADEAPGDGGG